MKAEGEGMKDEVDDIIKELGRIQRQTARDLDKLQQSILDKQAAYELNEAKCERLEMENTDLQTQNTILRHRLGE